MRRSGTWLHVSIHPRAPFNATRPTIWPVKLVKAQEAEEVTQADDLLDQVRDLRAGALAILGKAEEAGELSALAAIREARGDLELLAKLLGELDERPSYAALYGSCYDRGGIRGGQTPQELVAEEHLFF